MNKKRRKLGKGLDALLGDEALASVTKAAPQKPKASPVKKSEPEGDSLAQLKIADVQPGPWQPRCFFDETQLGELADSIKSKGVLQPVLVCKQGKGYALIAGERRWRAAQIAGLTTIPAIIRTDNDVDSSLLALIENIQRTDLDAMEVAKGMDNLLKKKLSHQEIASALGISRSAVTNTLRLLVLPESIKNLLQQKDIEMGHARAMLTLPEDQQLKVAHTVINKGLSVRQTEQLIKQIKEGTPKAEPGEKPLDPNISSLMKQMSEALSARVNVKHKQNGKGTLLINYNSLDQLQTFINKLAPQLANQNEAPEEK